MGKQVSERAGGATQVSEVKPPIPSKTSREYALPRSAAGQAETLHRSTGGRLSRASDALLQMQRHYGNRHVNRVIRHAQALTVQPKLALGEASTPHEVEADKIAQEVAGGGQITAAPTPVHGGAMAIAPETESAIKQARGGGRPLDSRGRASMERSFGADLSGVRLHTDDRAHALNEDLGAKAFTAGQDIFFRRGTFHEGSAEGKHLLAHEITHTLQQAPQASGLIQRTVWKWDGKTWVGGKNAQGQPDIPPGTYVNDTYNDVNHQYQYYYEPPDHGRKLRVIKPLSRLRYEKGIADKRADAAEELSKHTTLKGLYRSLAAHAYNYSNVPEQYIRATDEYTAFKKMRYTYVSAESAVLACRLAMRELEETGALDMAKDKAALFAKAEVRVKEVDATGKLVGKLKWMQGPDIQSDFAQWLIGGTGEPGAHGTMNCWESVLFGAYKAKAITKNQIVAVYQKVFDIKADQEVLKQNLEKAEEDKQSDWAKKSQVIEDIKQKYNELDERFPTLIEQFLITGQRREYDPAEPNSPRPLAGDIVFIGSMAKHVALATGNSDGSPQLLSLWNEPNNNDFLQRVTVADFISENAPAAFRSAIYFYRPSWA